MNSLLSLILSDVASENNNVGNAESLTFENTGIILLIAIAASLITILAYFIINRKKKSDKDNTD